MTAIQVASPAKLNLYLRILSRREDGYHNLQTLFQLIDLQDTLTIDTNHTGQITLDAPQCPCSPQDNLIVQAALKLKHHCPPHFGCHIQLDKKIPIGGGLGGGSSNAASTLLTLNRLWNIGLDTDELAQIGTRLGADVPVFVKGQSAWAQGTGDQLQPTTLPQRWYLVIHPNCHVSTAKLFQHPQLKPQAPQLDTTQFDLRYTVNDFEPLVLQDYPEIRNAHHWLSQFAPAHLTGTGACVFSVFGDQQSAEKVAKKTPNSWQSFTVCGLNTSPCLTQLEATPKL